MRELIVDSFAGGGGASTGIEMALGRSPDIAINHDATALAMHEVNHPGTLHLTEDVWNVDPYAATGGRPVGLAWFSPDCKHFSKAKGGKPVSKNIRGLAWVVVHWANTVKPRVIILENVEEFQTWGPAAPEELNDFHKRAFTVLGIVGGGIYNAPFSWDSVYWAPNAIGVSWFKSLATYDFRDLTRFVLLCHEARIRGEISSLAPQYLRIMLHQRGVEGGMARRHPNLEEALAEWRAEFPADHPLVYRDPIAESAQ